METDRFSDLWVSALALVITLALCRLSWLYFEKPLLKLGRRSEYTFEPQPSSSADEPFAIASKG
jgi:peptidoglycan/LPS O-acetylase OafA/YrhL